MRATVFTLPNEMSHTGDKEPLKRQVLFQGDAEAAVARVHAQTQETSFLSRLSRLGSLGGLEAGLHPVKVASLSQGQRTETVIHRIIS